MKLLIGNFTTINSSRMPTNSYSSKYETLLAVGQLEVGNMMYYRRNSGVIVIILKCLAMQIMQMKIGQNIL